MKKILPFSNPTITSWTWTAATFSILGNYPKCLPWLYNNFIQLFCECYEKWVSLHYIPHVDVFSVCPFFHSSLIPRSFLLDLNISLNSFIRTCINHNYYVYCIIDESYISRKKRFLHELLIYGYDDSTQTYNIADFTLTSTQKYTQSTTSYDSINKGYASIRPHEDCLTDGLGGIGGIYIFSVNPNYNYDFDIDLMKNYLNDYISGSDSGYPYRTYNLKRQTGSNTGLQSISYGLDIYDMLQKYYREVKQEEKTFFIQPLHVLYDHKYLMLQRLLYLNKELKFKIPNSLLKEYSVLFSEVNILRNLGIKYWVSRKVSALDTVISRLPGIKQKDLDLTTELINFLEIM